jgi:hypothetical protein
MENRVKPFINKQMKLSSFIIICTAFLAVACTVSKEGRVLKKTTKDWRESSSVFEAYADSPFAGSFLTLRKNKTFENTSSGMIKSFSAGLWTINQDTIHLSYLDSDGNLIREQNVILHRETSTLIFEGNDTPVPMRYRIRLDKLFD